MLLRSLLISALVASSAAFTIPTPSLARRSSSLSMTVKEVDTKDVIKVGVIGMGRIGLVHLEAITKAPGVTPVIVSNPTISKAEAGTWRTFVDQYVTLPIGLETKGRNALVYHCFLR